MAVGEAMRVRGESGSRPLGSIYLCLILFVIIGSSTAPAARFAVRELPVALLPIVRFGVAGLCLLPFTGGIDRWRRLLREDGGRLVLAAACCVPINQWFFLNGARLAPTSHVALIYASCPLFVLLLAAALGQERLRVDRLLGILTTVLGVLVIGLGSFWRGGVGGASPDAALRGDFLLIFAVASWASYLTLNKPLVARHGPLPVLAGTFLVGCLLDLPIALATWPGAAMLASASGAAWRGLAYLTLVVTVVGLALQNLALRRLDASEVATVSNAAPLLTVCWGIWLFHEPITPPLLIGGAITLGGILWASRPAPS